MTDPTILIVDDEPAIRDMVKLSLDVAGFQVLEAADARVAHTMVVDHRPDLVLLDWMLPGTSGIEFLRRLRRDENTREVPVIMLTARTDEENKLTGLEGGADDYITKPFSPRELIARIKAVLRRIEGANQEPVQLSGVRLEPASHRVFIDDQSVHLGPTEFKLLQFFMTHAERVFSRAQLLDQVWGGNVYVEERTVDVHIRRLRKALQLPDGQDYAWMVQTIRGSGYRFSDTMDS
ncbi:MAG TPA: phosphate regulon transcriptional regulator PhoB [Pseudomonadales bacterium]